MIGDKAPDQPQAQARRADPRPERREGRVADRAAAAGGSRPGLHGSQRRRGPRAGGRVRLQPQQVQPRHPGLPPAGLELQALHLFGGAGERLHRPPPSSTTRRSSSTPARPARCPGSRRTSMAASTARSACAPRSPNPRTWSRSGSCRRSRRSMRRTTSPASASIPSSIPPYLTMALGAGSVTPLEMATGYSVFANGGYRVAPYFISRVEDASGKVLAKAAPVRAGEGAQRAIDSRNAFVMYNMMQDVIRGGTGARAMSLGPDDLAGKTGTTNDQMDAWFAGFQRHLTCRGLGRLRSAALAGTERDRGGGGTADLDFATWARCSRTCREEVPGRSRGRDRRAHQSGDRVARPGGQEWRSSSSSSTRICRPRESRSRRPRRPRAATGRTRSRASCIERGLNPSRKKNKRGSTQPVAGKRLGQKPFTQGRQGAKAPRGYAKYPSRAGQPCRRAAAVGHQMGFASLRLGGLAIQPWVLIKERRRVLRKLCSLSIRCC